MTAGPMLVEMGSARPVPVRMGPPASRAAILIHSAPATTDLVYQPQGGGFVYPLTAGSHALQGGSSGALVPLRAGSSGAYVPVQGGSSGAYVPVGGGGGQQLVYSMPAGSYPPPMPQGGGFVPVTMGGGPRPDSPAGYQLVYSRPHTPAGSRGNTPPPMRPGMY